MSAKNLVYFGSPDFSAAILEAAATVPGIKVVGVVTSPDKPVGRKQIMTPSPVAALAARYDLPVFKPEKLTPENLAHLKLLKPDLFLVVSYGKIIPSDYLTTPARGTFNLHFSLLPKYRGALPISEVLKNGEPETGITLMVMDEQIDHGPIISQEKIGIDINDNCEILTNKLTQAAITLLTRDLPVLASGSFRAVPQDEAAATVTPSIRSRSRASAFLPWKQIKAALTGQDALTTHNLIRSNNPDPGAWTKIDDLELKIVKTTLLGAQLIIELVQLPGKSPISWASFAAGHPSLV